MIFLKSNTIHLNYIFFLYCTSTLYLWFSLFFKYILQGNLSFNQFFSLFLFFFALFSFLPITRSIFILLLSSNIFEKCVTTFSTRIPFLNLPFLCCLGIFYCLIERDTHVLQLIQVNFSIKILLFCFVLLRAITFSLYFYYRLFKNDIVIYLFQNKKIISSYLKTTHFLGSSQFFTVGEIAGIAKIFPSITAKALSAAKKGYATAEGMMGDVPKKAGNWIKGVGVAGVGTWVISNGEKEIDLRINALKEQKNRLIAISQHTQVRNETLVDHLLTNPGITKSHYEYVMDNREKLIDLLEKSKNLQKGTLDITQSVVKGAKNGIAIIIKNQFIKNLLILGIHYYIVLICK